MKQPVTYVGFFQGGQSGSTSYWNFYPVAQLLGTRYEMAFPWGKMYQGRLQLKQKNTQYENHTLRNISLSEIDHAAEGTLHKVTFDEAFFENDNERYYNRIELPEECLVEDAIRVEELALNEFLGNNVSILIQTKDLSLGKGSKACVLTEYFSRGERSLSEVRANEILYSILSEDKAVVSVGVKPKIMTFFDNMPAFMLNEEIEAYDAKASGIETINVAIRANDWVSDWEGSRYEDVDYLQFVRIKEVDPIGTIHLIWEKEVTKGYANISTFQPEVADFFMLFSA